MQKHIFNHYATLLFVLFISIGCDDSASQDKDTGGGDTDTDTDNKTGSDEPQNNTTSLLDGECPLDKVFGAFSVNLDEEYSSASGSVSNGLAPAENPSPIDELGDCQLLRRVVPVCEQTCPNGQACNTDGTCIPQPVKQDAGTVTIDGLMKAVSMTPLAPGNTYFDTTLPHPAFNPGDEIHLTSTEGFAGTMDMHGYGVDPLRILDEVWLIDQGKELNVNWSKPTNSKSSEVLLLFDVNQHGTSPLFIRCVFEDTGQATVPVALIDKLLTLDESAVSGYPNGRLIRRTVDSQSLPDNSGCVEFIVASPRNATVRVAGFIPCKKQADCSDGMTCNMTSNLCE